MVTQEGVASSNEPLQVDRKSLTAAAIRRGDVKISEPISWEEQNYTPPPPTASQRRLQHAASDSRTQIAVVQHRSAEALATPAEAADEGEQREQSFESAPRSPPLRHKRASLSMREDSEVQGHTTPVHQMMKRESGITDSPASGGSQLQPKKKRRSGAGTIKGVFRRLFSKRDKDTPPQYLGGKSSTSPGSRRHGYHRSDPIQKTVERATKEQYLDHKSNSPVERIPVPPAEEYTATTPIPQRLPFPMNVNAPQPESPGEHYTSFNGPYVHRRRATLPSVILSPQDASALRKFWTTPDAHLASSSDRSASQHSPSPLIGVAVTSGANPNRRSRSTGALYDLAKESEQVEHRRRSAEIQYWRQSYKGQEPEIVALEQEPEMKESSERHSEQGSIISEHHSGTEISAALADAGSSIRDEPAIQSITTYDFAPSMPPSREMAEAPGPEETTATEKETPGTVLDQRLSHLEENMRTLTSSIHDLTGRAHRQTVILESAPRSSRQRMERLSHSQSSPTMQRPPEPTAGPGHSSNSKDIWPAPVPSRRFQQPSPPSSGASTASIQKTAQAPGSEASYLYPRSAGVSPSGSGRPVTYQQEMHFISPESVNFDAEQPLYASQRDTIIPPSLPSPSIYTHLAPLYSALRYERTQRKGMEAKLDTLTEQVTTLTSIISSMRKSSASHGEGAPEGAGPSWKQRSRFSGYDDSDNEGEGGDTTPMVTPMEEWATPRQEFAPPKEASAELGSPIEGEMF